VLVPGVTDAAENVDAVARFTASPHDVERVEARFSDHGLTVL
jgi:pyruvate-formate lyase-activating enzyme